MTYEELAAKLQLPKVPEHFAEAFTHRSYAAEHNLNYDNQRLEFLGDAVLELCISGWLYRSYTDYREGNLTKIRSYLACEKTLSVVAKKLGLCSMLLVGNGEAAVNGHLRDSTAADLLESVFGAIYLDCGFDCIKGVISRLSAEFVPNPHVMLEDINPKGRLQEFTQNLWGEPPQYSVLSVSGPDHSPEYLVEAGIRDCVAFGRGSGRKKAEIAAAAELLRLLREKYPQGKDSKEEQK